MTQYICNPLSLSRSLARAHALSRSLGFSRSLSVSLALDQFLTLWLSLQVSGVVETGQYVYFKALITNPRASIKILLKSKSGDPDLVPKP